MKKNSKKYTMGEAFEGLRIGMRRYMQHEEDCKLFFEEHGITWASLITAMREDIVSSYRQIEDDNGVSKQVAEYEATIGSLNNYEDVDFVREYLSHFNTEWLSESIKLKCSCENSESIIGLMKLLDLECKKCSLIGPIDTTLILQLVFGAFSSNYELIMDHGVIEINLILSKDEEARYKLSELSLMKLAKMCSIYLSELISYSIEIEKSGLGDNPVTKRHAYERTEHLKKWNRESQRWHIEKILYFCKMNMKLLLQ